MTNPLLLCTDLDRTLIPNGREPESPEARPRFRAFVADESVTLAYVTGRHRALVEEAIADYDLPRPDYLVGDVGTSIYALESVEWRQLTAWQEEIGGAWAGVGHAGLQALVDGIEGLSLQEPEKQGPFKLSYYTPPEIDSEALRASLHDRLAARGIRASLIWSVDEAAGKGLLDLLPENASKYHAVDFLMGLLGRDEATTLFAGDSGNDLEVLTSHIPSVLVANGHPDVRETAQRLSAERGLGDRLYCARGDWSGMNGNYSAGILEGVAHFRPDLAARLHPS